MFTFEKLANMRSLVADLSLVTPLESILTPINLVRHVTNVKASAHFPIYFVLGVRLQRK